MEPHVAWVDEQRTSGEGWLAGRFTVRLERAIDAPKRPEIERVADLEIDAALTWARERAGLVLVQFGLRHEYWSAGSTPHWGYPAWPPPDLPPLIERPAPATSWLTEPPGHTVFWAVTFRLRPDNLAEADDPARREAWDIAIALSAARDRLSWDNTQLRNHLADRRQAATRGGGFVTAWSPVYQVHAIEAAESAASAERQARERYLPPAGFAVSATTRPADLSETVLRRPNRSVSPGARERSDR